MRKLTESAKIRIIKAEGSALDIQGRGDAAGMMLLAFKFLSSERREWLISQMQDAHEKLGERHHD